MSRDYDYDPRTDYSYEPRGWTYAAGRVALGAGVMALSFWLTLKILDYKEGRPVQKNDATLAQKPARAPVKLENMVSNSEQLNAAGQVAASFEREPTRGVGSIAEYELAATGEAGEHYAALAAKRVAAGTYTLSVQVRPRGTARVRVQLLDAANNGILGDVDLEHSQVNVSKMGSPDLVRGEVIPKGEWQEVNLTTAFEVAGNPMVVLQLFNNRGSNTFAPAGEKALFRALQIVAGTAAPQYPGLE